jgi:hypothetical protein
LALLAEDTERRRLPLWERGGSDFGSVQPRFAVDKVRQAVDYGLMGNASAVLPLLDRATAALRQAGPRTSDPKSGQSDPFNVSDAGVTEHVVACCRMLTAGYRFHLADRDAVRRSKEAMLEHIRELSVARELDASARDAAIWAIETSLDAPTEYVPVGSSRSLASDRDVVVSLWLWSEEVRHFGVPGRQMKRALLNGLVALVASSGKEWNYGVACRVTYLIQGYAGLGDAGADGSPLGRGALTREIARTAMESSRID